MKGATLEVTTGNLGLGDVLVTGGTLMLDNASSIADAAGLTVNGTGAVNLNFSGIETVGALTVGTTPFGPGTYSSADLGSAFTGGGQLRVAAVPEPAAAGMLAVGAVVMGRRRRRGGRERVSD